MDPCLEGRFSIEGSQKAIQLAARCLKRDPKARPLMSEVVDILKPLPYLKDMACSSSHFEAMQAERFSSSPSTRNGSRMCQGLSRNVRPNGPHASPYNNKSPTPNNSRNVRPNGPHVSPYNNKSLIPNTLRNVRPNGPHVSPYNNKLPTPNARQP
ncbi:hypothetical protein JCGZ_17139 [Jatropha curcas]|uniref:Protein kinase domain-containing protein n=1 Tax=Jatropha curcas TaxID=180498 RepID=A0A067K2J8_JATCU|nr:hypothetical protein JCGZ_17139 [Jatropha curcas]